jgi:hypothetical protein
MASLKDGGDNPRDNGGKIGKKLQQYRRQIRDGNRIIRNIEVADDTDRAVVVDFKIVMVVKERNG